jgi:hypothetical protein
MTAEKVGASRCSMQKARFGSRAFVAVGVSAALCFMFACSTQRQESTFEDGPNVVASPTDPDTRSFPSYRADCSGGISCKQVDCPPDAITTLTGTVTAPNGTLPLYNAIVYVPNGPLEALTDGVTCDRCGNVSAKALVSTLTDVNGRFELKDVPVGDKIPLVVQIGKWRRQVEVSIPKQCTENKITDPDLTRLPRNRKEGSIPRIAVTTGWCDQLACLLPKLGLDASEFTASDGDGRLHLYRGASHKIGGKVQPAPAPSGTRDAKDLYDNAELMKSYDMVMLSCECGEHNETKSDAARTGMYDYASSGGRVFASHFHYTWAEQGPLSTAAQWSGSESNPENPPGPYLIDRSFPKGDSFAQWLVAVDATKTLGEMPINQARENVGGVRAAGQRWVYSKTENPSLASEAPEATKYLSINTPVAKPAEEQCGKFVYADMHLYGGDEQDPATALPNDQFPQSCSKDLTSEEKALAFLFFDLSSCVQDDRKPPVR